MEIAIGIVFLAVLAGAGTIALFIAVYWLLKKRKGR